MVEKSFELSSNPCLLARWIKQDEFDHFAAALEYIADVNEIFMIEFYNTTLLLYALKNRPEKTIRFITGLYIEDFSFLRLKRPVSARGSKTA